MAKNDNLLAILWMLNSGVKITAKQISEKLEIDIKAKDVFESGTGKYA